MEINKIEIKGDIVIGMEMEKRMDIEVISLMCVAAKAYQNFWNSSPGTLL